MPLLIERPRIHCSSPSLKVLLAGSNLLKADDEPDATQIRPKMFWIGSCYWSFSLANPSRVHSSDYSRPLESRELALQQCCTKPASQPDSHLQLRLFRSYLLLRLRKAASLWCVCNTRIIFKFHKETPKLLPGAAHGAQAAFAMASSSSFNCSVCSIWVFFSSTPDTMSLWQVQKFHSTEPWFSNSLNLQTPPFPPPGSLQLTVNDFYFDGMALRSSLQATKLQM